MTDITIRVENDNLFHSIENVLNALKGIRILSIKKGKSLYDPEIGAFLKDSIIENIDDVKSGREKTYSFDNPDEAIKWLKS